MQADELLAQIMAINEVVLPRGTIMNDGRRIGVDYGGTGQFHMTTTIIKRGERAYPIHVDDDDQDQVRIKYAEAVIAGARELADA
jgi:hypothetical protein